MATAGSFDWHSTEGMYEAVKKFHDTHCRQPSMEEERKINEVYKKEISDKLQAEGICHRLQYAGSAYEGVKVCKTPTDPDKEFDILVILKGGADLITTQVQPRKPGFATLKLKQGLSSSTFPAVKLDADGTVSATGTTTFFFSKLQKIINDSTQMRDKVKLINHGPAVQMDVYEGMAGGRKLYSVDMVPTHEIGGPQNGEQYVSKPIKGVPMNAKAWRRSFSFQEKQKFDAIDGDGGCRKQVLRVLKVLRNREAGLAKLTSYHLKTALFKEVDAQENWSYKTLAVRVIDVLGRIEVDLTNGRMQHYFMPEVDLFESIPVTAIQNMRDRIRSLRASETKFTRAINC